MRSIQRQLMIVAALCLAGSIQWSAAGEWETLFDGNSTSAFRGYKRDSFPNKGWEVVDGALRTIPGGDVVDIITKKEYDDFELRFEWKVSPGGNSGVFYNVAEGGGAIWHTGPEYQVLDDGGHPDGRNAKTSAGSLYALIPPGPKKSLKPVGEFNQSKIVVKGNHVEHWLNGEKVVEFQWGSPEVSELIANSKFAQLPNFMKEEKGYIGFQHHGQEVWFRAIQIRELNGDKETAGKSAGWHMLFDGSSTEGWRAFGKREFPKHRWEVQNGTLHLRPGGGGGDIITEGTYRNFILEWEWKLAPHANNGLKYFVLSSRKGAVGHEYQMIDDGKGGEHGTASFYDVLAPQTEVPLKQAGEWNHSRIVADGEQVEHWLNGKKVLEYRLGSPELMKAIEASKFRSVEAFGTSVAGHILLTDHHDEAWYRNIKIKQLH